MFPDGNYIIKIFAIDFANLTSQPVSLALRIERVAPVISQVKMNVEQLKVFAANKAQLQFHLSEDATVEVKVFDANNHFVFTLQQDMLKKGMHLITWDGKLDGKFITNGTYQLRINVVDQANKRPHEMVLRLYVSSEFRKSSMI
jgi:flagellar hook assembly protein FlgD